MLQKFNVGIVTFSYGGNGGISSEVPDIREWMTPLVVELSKDPRIDAIRIWNLADTPITMTRNRAVLQAREYGVDVLVMVDSDMKPDKYAGQPDAKPFFQSSFDFFVDHYHRGPCIIGAPYCGPPPVECVYVFRWNNQQNGNPNPDFQLEMYDRHTAVKMAGIQECAALPTGLIMYDMRAFELTEPKKPDDKPWFYYEWSDIYASNKASTEDVTMTRDASLVGIQKLGYNPVYCNWDAWAGHWKPKCVGKPQVISASGVSHKLKDCWDANVEPDTKLVDFRSVGKFPKPEFDGMGMDLPGQDANALAALISQFSQEHGRTPTVCEVGSWAGRSAIIMAKHGARVTCVNTWEGSKNDDGCKAYDGSRSRPLDVFRKNTAGYPITAHVGQSPAAARDFDDHSFDIVYLDAEHDYASVKADIEAWKPKARYVLAGHDYHAFPDVQRAVKDCGLTPHVEGNVWMAGVDNNVRLIDFRSPIADRIKAGALDQYVRLSDGSAEKMEWLKGLMDRAPVGTFLEIGNREGGSLLLALDHPNSTAVVGVDPYGGLPYKIPNGPVTNEYDDDMHQRMLAAVRNSPNAAKLTHHKMTSERYMSLGQRAYAFVYLDGSHDPDVVQKEIDYFIPQLQPGGIIAVDDTEVLPASMLTGWERRGNRAWLVNSG